MKSSGILKHGKVILHSSPVPLFPHNRTPLSSFPRAAAERHIAAIVYRAHLCYSVGIKIIYIMIKFVSDVYNHIIVAFCMF